MEKFEKSYEVDRDLLLLFDFIVLLNGALNLPEKYEKILTQLEIDLSSEVFKRPMINQNVALVEEKITLTDVYEIEKSL